MLICITTSLLDLIGDHSFPTAVHGLQTAMSPYSSTTQFLEATPSQLAKKFESERNFVAREQYFSLFPCLE